MKTKVFVSGATGVIGRRVVPRLVAAGHAVTAIARNEDKAAVLEAAGATALAVDVFSREQMTAAVADHDVVINLATHIPTGTRAGLRPSWRQNDRLRTEGAAILARAALDGGAERYIGESITFPYVDSGDEWIDETAQRTYFWGNESVVNAERAAQSVTDAGRTGVTLRFSMFHAIDSQHMRTFISMAEKGICGIPGDPEGYISFIAVDDAARAVLAAFDVPAGVYNVSESDPVRRSEHAAALTACTNRERLRAIPTTAQHLGGKGIDSLSRSQRISSKALTEATSWEPKIHPINRWRLVH